MWWYLCRTSGSTQDGGLGAAVTSTWSHTNRCQHDQAKLLCSIRSVEQQCHTVHTQTGQVTLPVLTLLSPVRGGHGAEVGVAGRRQGHVWRAPDMGRKVNKQLQLCIFACPYAIKLTQRKILTDFQRYFLDSAQPRV